MIQYLRTSFQSCHILKAEIHSIKNIAIKLINSLGKFRILTTYTGKKS